MTTTTATIGAEEERTMSHDDSRPRTDGAAKRSCHECPVATASRRAFLRDIGLTVVGALALGAGLRPASALAASVSETHALSGRGARRTYGLPATDSISIDPDNDVILARWQNRVYAFSLRCPHRGSRLEWRSAEQRVFCPKHKARFRPDGAHDSGRRARDLDRYELGRQGSSIVVNLDALHHADEEPDAWRAAVIVVA
jgi:nitrite reductase/ring-hydroxylating ferredoxin subunit